VRWSPACEEAIPGADDIVGIRHQATTCEDTADLDDLVLVVVNCIFGRISYSAVINCSYEFQEFNLTHSLMQLSPS
jgi:hypothetical protein